MHRPDRGVLRLRDLDNAAGALTIGRLFIAVTFPAFAHDAHLALSVYLVAVATDVLDGWWARKTNTQSHTGAVLDGWVDKTLHINAAWSMTIHGMMPAWWMLLWFSREIVQAGMVLWLVGAFRQGEVRIQSTSLTGRVTAVSLTLAFVATLLDLPALALPLSVLTGVAGVACALGYLRRALDDRSQFR